MLKQIKAFFTLKPRPPAPRENYTLIDNREKFWGNNVNWMRENHIAGWRTPLPVNGDVLLQPMKSGKVGLYILLKVEYCGDPDDMYFADVTFWKYQEENEADLDKNKAKA